MTGRDGSPPVASIGIVGLGLIGGSIALKLRDVWPSVRIAGVDRPEAIDAALDQGAIDEPCGSIADLAGRDLVVLAAPVGEIVRSMDEAARLGPRTVVTDVGSTKRRVMEAAARACLPRFVGGHPMAGLAESGLAHARPDLFEKKPWLLVPAIESDEDAYDLVATLVRALGARPERIEALEHDRFMACVSHVPQLVSTALMTAAGHAVGESGLAVAGPGFRDLTRLASSGANVWTDILATNADCIAEALAAFSACLPSSVTELSDARAVAARFEQAQGWRERLLKLSAVDRLRS
jgi:prephenate dehydrogenase